MHQPSHLALLFLAVTGCGAPPSEVVRISDALLDRPLRGASDDELRRFLEGDALFDLAFREADGLGPLFVRSACGSCHEGAANGPGGVEKMAVPGEEDALPFGNTVRPFLAAGATHAVAAPEDRLNLQLSFRLGPSVFGRGYIEAVDDRELARLEAEQSFAVQGVTGRVHRVRYQSEQSADERFHRYVKGDSNLFGRFGFKARIATLDDFTADALQAEMGLTSPLRPHELPNPDGLPDDRKPGVDVDLTLVSAITDYVRLLELPRRLAPNPEGARLFRQVGCDTCHVPSLRTRPDYPIAALAGIDAPLFSDLLLHDMGDALADGQTDGDAGPREWRTAPLIGLRYLRSYLHDGRARSIEEAIDLHLSPGSEATHSVQQYRMLGASQRAQLLAFVSSL